jgi:hypothetical protein
MPPLSYTWVRKFISLANFCLVLQFTAFTHNYTYLLDHLVNMFKQFRPGHYLVKMTGNFSEPIKATLKIWHRAENLAGNEKYHPSVAIIVLSHVLKY